MLREVRLPHSSLYPDALREFVRTTAGIDTLLLWDGGLTLGQSSATVLTEAQEDVRESKLATTNAWRLPSNSRPWQRPSWFSYLRTWLTGILQARNEQLVSVQQVSSYDLACLPRLETTGGVMYFKAGDASREAAITAHLAAHHFELTPTVIACDSANDWLLTRDGGQRAHEQVRELGLSELACHGDAQPMNALVGDTSCRWFDWSEVCIAHPFTDIGWRLAWLWLPSRGDVALPLTHDAISRLWQTYLKSLGLSEAEPLLPEAMMVTLLQRALVYHERLATFQGTVRGWQPQYVRYYLRLLLKAARMLEP